MNFKVGDLVKVEHYYKSYIAIVVKIHYETSFTSKYELIGFKPTIPNVTLFNVSYIDKNYLSAYSIERLKCDNYKMYKDVLLQLGLIEYIKDNTPDKYEDPVYVDTVNSYDVIDEIKEIIKKLR